MFSWYKYLIVSLVFSHLGFWSGSLFLIAPFPDLCLLVLFYMNHALYTLLQIGFVSDLSKANILERPEHFEGAQLCLILFVRVTDYRLIQKNVSCSRK